MPTNDAIKFEAGLKSIQDQYNGAARCAGTFVMRRDADRADDDYNYIVTSIWKDQSAYAAWREANLARNIAGREFFYEGKLALSDPKGI